MSENTQTNNIEEERCCRPKMGGNCYNCNSYSLVYQFEIMRYRDAVEGMKGSYSVFCPICGAENTLDERVYENHIDIYSQSSVARYITEEILLSLRTNFNRDYISKKVALLETDLEFTLAEVALSGKLDSNINRIRLESEALHLFTKILNEVDRGVHGKVKESKVSTKIKKTPLF